METYERFIPIHEQFIRETLFEALETEGFKLLIKNDLDLWDFELPKELQGEAMVLDITGWCKDQCFIEEYTFSITTAFGEDEYSITLPLENIIQIVTFEGAVLYQKTLPFEAQVPKEIVEPVANIKISSKDTEGLRHSMKTLKMNNPNIFKK